jgi:hypothetical protein
MFLKMIYESMFPTQTSQKFSLMLVPYLFMIIGSSAVPLPSQPNFALASRRSVSLSIDNELSSASPENVNGPGMINANARLRINVINVHPKLFLITG